MKPASFLVDPKILCSGLGECSAAVSSPLYIFHWYTKPHMSAVDCQLQPGVFAFEIIVEYNTINLVTWYHSQLSISQIFSINLVHFSAGVCVYVWVVYSSTYVCLYFSELRRLHVHISMCMWRPEVILRYIA
jgi:hypothetical protein